LLYRIGATSFENVGVLLPVLAAKAAPDRAIAVAARVSFIVFLPKCLSRTSGDQPREVNLLLYLNGVFCGRARQFCKGV
jgi:hypothetical protein